MTSQGCRPEKEQPEPEQRRARSRTRGSSRSAYACHPNDAGQPGQFLQESKPQRPGPQRATCGTRATASGRSYPCTPIAYGSLAGGQLYGRWFTGKNCLVPFMTIQSTNMRAGFQSRLCKPHAVRKCLDRFRFRFLLAGRQRWGGWLRL